MRKLNKEQIKERDDISARLATALNELQTTINDFNEQVKNLYEDTVGKDLAALNEVIEEASQFKEDIISEMDSYVSDRSEKWPESEGGQTYIDWQIQWQYVDIERIEIGPPDNIEQPDFDAEILANLPEEPG